MELMEILYCFLNFSKQFKTRFFVMERRFRTSDTKVTAPRKTAGQRVAPQRIYMKVFAVAEEKKQECINITCCSGQIVSSQRKVNL